ncbi:MAG: transglycosylase family protein [Candidatus Nanopelagicales bacterium]
MPAVALLAASAVAAGPAVTSASAAPSLGSYKNDRPVSDAHFKRFKLKGYELKQIKKSKKWARSSKARSVRQCESGGNYKINTGNGYYGAWQFAGGTWRGIGGGRYASTANKAPKFAQDHMAWKLWKKQGWGPWSCA